MLNIEQNIFEYQNMFSVFSWKVLAEEIPIKNSSSFPKYKDLRKGWSRGIEDLSDLWLE
jgi:hypothetical protein